MGEYRVKKNAEAEANRLNERHPLEDFVWVIYEDGRGWSLRAKQVCR